MITAKALYLTSTLLVLTSTASAHMLVGSESVWGYGADLEMPLNAGSSNWFCHGQSGPSKTPVQLKPGGNWDVPIMCGEAVDDPTNAADICSADPNAFHGGGGCGLSIAYKSNPSSLTDFTLISVAANCPNDGNPVSFKLPPNLPAGEAVCSWIWIPNPNASADEMYMNCFDCTVSGSTSGAISGAHPVGWAVPGIGADGERPMYKDKFEDGAQVISVDGKSGGDYTKDGTTGKGESGLDVKVFAEGDKSSGGDGEGDGKSEGGDGGSYEKGGSDNEGDSEGGDGGSYEKGESDGEGSSEGGENESSDNGRGHSGSEEESGGDESLDGNGDGGSYSHGKDNSGDSDNDSESSPTETGKGDEESSDGAPSSGSGKGQWGKGRGKWQHRHNRDGGGKGYSKGGESGSEGSGYSKGGDESGDSESGYSKGGDENGDSEGGDEAGYSKGGEESGHSKGGWSKGGSEEGDNDTDYNKGGDESTGGDETNGGDENNNGEEPQGGTQSDANKGDNSGNDYTKNDNTDTESGSDSTDSSSENTDSSSDSPYDGPSSADNTDNTDVPPSSVDGSSDSTGDYEKTSNERRRRRSVLPGKWGVVRRRL
ncbi:hypothetical protein HDV00_003734 [Rhizophlyctis rosea]|nr:hypothetical protein HDV00_003734 [Rhizophlyctis rosea]